MKKQRQSNIELLRIALMFLIVILHANFATIGVPDVVDLYRSPIYTIFRFQIESLSIVCVNVFIIISGWFSLQPKVRSICSFLFQILFFYILLYAVEIIIGVVPLDANGLSHTLLLSKVDYFIKGYLFLLIFVPILNTYVDNTSEVVQRKVLCWFFGFQTLFGWASHGAEFFMNGYSGVSFVGLYLLARYVRVFGGRFYTLSKYVDLLVYLLCTFVITSIAIIATCTGWKQLYIVYNYSCPLVIIGALYLFLFFSKISITSRFVNWVAASSFAVYLFHRQFGIFELLFKPIIKHIYETQSHIYASLEIGCVISFFFVVAILIDQVRLLIWNKIINVRNSWDIADDYQHNE